MPKETKAPLGAGGAPAAVPMDHVERQSEEIAVSFESLSRLVDHEEGGNEAPQAVSVMSPKLVDQGVFQGIPPIETATIMLTVKDSNYKEISKLIRKRNALAALRRLTGVKGLHANASIFLRGLLYEHIFALLANKIKWQLQFVMEESVGSEAPVPLPSPTPSSAGGSAWGSGAWDAHSSLSSGSYISSYSEAEAQENEDDEQLWPFNQGDSLPPSDASSAPPPPANGDNPVSPETLVMRRRGHGRDASNVSQPFMLATFNRANAKRSLAVEVDAASDASSMAGSYVSSSMSSASCSSFASGAAPVPKEIVIESGAAPSANLMNSIKRLKQYPADGDLDRVKRKGLVTENFLLHTLAAIRSKARKREYGLIDIKACLHDVFFQLFLLNDTDSRGIIDMLINYIVEQEEPIFSPLLAKERLQEIYSEITANKVGARRGVVVNLSKEIVLATMGRIRNKSNDDVALYIAAEVTKGNLFTLNDLGSESVANIFPSVRRRHILIKFGVATHNWLEDVGSASFNAFEDAPLLLPDWAQKFSAFQQSIEYSWHYSKALIDFINKYPIEQDRNDLIVKILHEFVGYEGVKNIKDTIVKYALVLANIKKCMLFVCLMGEDIMNAARQICDLNKSNPIFGAGNKLLNEFITNFRLAKGQGVQAYCTNVNISAKLAGCEKIILNTSRSSEDKYRYMSNMERDYFSFCGVAAVLEELYETLKKVFKLAEEEFNKSKMGSDEGGYKAICSLNNNFGAKVIADQKRLEVLDEEIARVKAELELLKKVFPELEGQIASTASPSTSSPVPDAYPRPGGRRASLPNNLQPNLPSAQAGDNGAPSPSSGHGLLEGIRGFFQRKKPPVGSGFHTAPNSPGVSRRVSKRWGVAPDGIEVRTAPSSFRGVPIVPALKKDLEPVVRLADALDLGAVTEDQSPSARLARG
jgi:hypothetical protein